MAQRSSRVTNSSGEDSKIGKRKEKRRLEPLKIARCCEEETRPRIKVCTD